VANQRFQIVQRHLNGGPPPDGPSVPERTLRLWAARFREAKGQHGSGYLGLIPQTSQRGNRGNKLPEESRTLLNQFIEQDYETFKQKSQFVAWAALLHACEEKGIVAPSYVTFCLATRRRPVFESVLKRKGPEGRLHSRTLLLGTRSNDSPAWRPAARDWSYRSYRALCGTRLFAHWPRPGPSVDDATHRRFFPAVPCAVSRF